MQAGDFTTSSVAEVSDTVDSLTTVRKLKDSGVEVYFEKENIWTLDSKGELLITIMSSLAQEESRSISENVTWGQQKRFADGKVSIPYEKHNMWHLQDSHHRVNRSILAIQIEMRCKVREITLFLGKYGNKKRNRNGHVCIHYGICYGKAAAS